MTTYDPAFRRSYARWERLHDPGDDRRWCELCGELALDEDGDPRCEDCAGDFEPETTGKERE